MSDNSITTIARHQVIPGKEEQFFTWLDKTSKACENYKGYIGTKTSSPINPENNEYVTIFRFDNLENLDRWLNSETRKLLLVELNSITQGKTTISKISGIDYYFENSKKELSLPYMTLITYLGLMPLVLFIPPLFKKYLNHQGIYLSFTSTALIVILMSYLVMPMLVKLSYFGIQISEKIWRRKQ